MGIFFKLKYVGYNLGIRCYQDGFDFQDFVVRQINSNCNLDLLEEPFRFRGDGFLRIDYRSESLKDPQVIVFITDFTVLIGFAQNFVSEEKIVSEVKKALQEFNDAGISINYESNTKPIKDFELFRYMRATAGLF